MWATLGLGDLADFIGDQMGFVGLYGIVFRGHDIWNNGRRFMESSETLENASGKHVIGICVVLFSITIVQLCWYHES